MIDTGIHAASATAELTPAWATERSRIAPGEDNSKLTYATRVIAAPEGRKQAKYAYDVVSEDGGVIRATARPVDGGWGAYVAGELLGTVRTVSEARALLTAALR